MNRLRSIKPTALATVSTVAGAWVLYTPRAGAHFGFNDGHPDTGLAILVYGGALAVLGILVYFAFFGKGPSESDEPED